MLIPRLMTFAKALNRNLWQNFLLRNQISFYTQHILETEMSHGVENITHCESFLIYLLYIGVRRQLEILNITYFPLSVN